VIHSFSREQLFYRHRLTHRQIDDVLGKDATQNTQEEVMSSLAKVGEFLKITDAFKEAKLPFISLKGPLLSYKIYGDATYRYFKDFDFLMDFKDINNAANLLAEYGYQTDLKLLFKDHCKLKLLLSRTNQIEFYNPITNTSIEIHVRLFRNVIISNEDLNPLVKKNTTEVNFMNRAFHVLNHEFELMYLIIHGSSHLWGRLKWLLDVRELTERFTLDQTKFLELTNLFQAHHLVALCNALLDNYFPNSKKLPQKLQASTKLVNNSLKTIKSKSVFEKQNISNLLLFHYRCSQLFPGLKYKQSYIKNLFFSPELALQKWMPCSIILNYLISPFWKIIR
jgi:hypothetical protein